MKTLRQWLRIGVAAVILLPPGVTAQSARDEYRLKAAFVYRFPQFVEWPDAAVATWPTLDLCVLQPNPFGR
jgi:hypothetical protein